MNTRKKALVIDDDALVRRIFSKMLSERNIESVEITNGADAETLLRKEGKNLTLAIVDLVLPRGPTGWDIIDLIRNNPDIREMPVIVITGALISSDEIARLKQKVDYVIRKKDFSMDKFSGFLDDLLKERKK